MKFGIFLALLKDSGMNMNLERQSGLFLYKESYFAKYLLDGTWSTKDIPLPTAKCLELVPTTYQRLPKKRLSSS